ncbi:alpha/beta hydrolase [Pseudoroseicyclus tamaricis]|uniref:Alpha/beta hydrolase n=1 Tax=Pseudoroseicyclus tamaricis TaxID=2705421 RepID=A0A6B2JZQ4_9RHOB|nr:alpha/beta hydrolase [Pseudoroseicyclus tamaricis]NDU99605.1 alpha/beta hydrolase [Pseudoroseicyclus tamaricis]
MTATPSYHARRHPPAEGAPLIFAFHGTGGDEDQFFELVRQLQPRAGIVSPRGDVSEGGAARFFRRTGEGVYDMDDLALRTERMAAFIAAEAAEHPGAPVYGFGYSNGANILASVVMAQPRLFERVGLLHPLIPWEPPPVDLSGRRMLVTAGRRDPICPWPLSEKLIRWAGDQGAEVETVLHDGGHEVRPVEVEGLGRLLA